MFYCHEFFKTNIINQSLRNNNNKEWKLYYSNICKFKITIHLNFVKSYFYCKSNAIYISFLFS